jgi:hypothetical protein
MTKSSTFLKATSQIDLQCVLNNDVFSIQNEENASMGRFFVFKTILCFSSRSDAVSGYLNVLRMAA